MRKLIVLAAMTFLPSWQALANVSVSIGINVPYYPTLQRIPGYPVYYVPRLHANYFFYDGLYWVYVPDGWYVSPWYNGPWDPVAIDSVPLFVLRIPVRYYGYPPVAFRQWGMNVPPRWDVVWGPDWAHRHQQWQRWNRAAAPPPAPLPRYQKRYTGTNYPNDAQRSELVQHHYNYVPRDTQVRQQWQALGGGTANQPHARPSPPHDSQAQQARPHDTRPNDLRPAELDDTRGKRAQMPRQAPAGQADQPRIQANIPRDGSDAVHGRAEGREPARHATPDHGERHDKQNRADDREDNKAEKGRGHEPDKHR